MPERAWVVLNRDVVYHPGNPHFRNHDWNFFVVGARHQVQAGFKDVLLVQDIAGPEPNDPGLTVQAGFSGLVVLEDWDRNHPDVPQGHVLQLALILFVPFLLEIGDIFLALGRERGSTKVREPVGFVGGGGRDIGP